MTKCGFRVDCLRSRIDEAFTDLFILCSKWNETAPRSLKFAPALLNNYGRILCRGQIVEAEGREEGEAVSCAEQLKSSRGGHPCVWLSLDSAANKCAGQTIELDASTSLVCYS